MPLSSDIIESIKTMTVSKENPNRLELPPIGSPMSNYPAVKRSLLAAGGKYIKSGFLFSTGAQSIKDRLCGGESINDKKKFQVFETPLSIAEACIKDAELGTGGRLLEPSAGRGAIASLAVIECPAHHLIEIQPESVDFLVKEGFNVTCADFLDLTSSDIGTFDRIIMNPPFAKKQDMRHVKHAISEFLEDGGVLVAIMGTGWQHINHKENREFKEFLDHYEHEVFEIEANAFKESGTGIATTRLVLHK